MRHSIINRICCLVAAIVGLTALSSCEIYSSYPPPGHNDTGYDRNLTGSWELAYVNGHGVYGYETNWLDFYGDGYGVYYYNDGPYTYELPFDYYCQYDYDNWLCIHYADGTYAEMVYWFNHDFTTLYLEWYSHGQRVVYTYFRVDYMYWDTPPINFKMTRSDSSAIISDLRPGYVAESADEE